MAKLEIRLLGDIQVLREGAAVALPASKKTRALLAYLIVSGRPQRRDRLCELFWERPDDPRGALRWSLSKLRKVVNDDYMICLTADRERVSFDTTSIKTDIGEIEEYFSNPDASADSLRKGIAILQEQPFLDGLDQLENHSFRAWLAGEQEKIQRLLASATGRLISHPDTRPDRALAYALQWVEEAPYSTAAANALVGAYRRLGQNRNADAAVARFRAHFEASAIAWEAAPSSPTMVRLHRDTDNSLLGDQKIQFCKAPDGVSIAYASVGSGSPLVKAANWLSHLELDWQAPIWSPLFRELAKDNRFIRYDERGNGLSDWNVPELSQETFVADLEAVVDSLELDCFPLLGISQGAAVSIEYAARHPERVSKLILFGGYAKGWRVDATNEEIAEREAIITLTKTGWGRDNPAYRHIFSATFMPGATAEQLAWFDDFQRQTTNPSNAAAFLSAFGDIDVRHHLSKIAVPTLVLHSRGDKRIPWEVGRDIAAQIPNATLVTLDSDNHLLLEGEPAAASFVDAVSHFLAG